jgi:hypothetical protein
MKPLQVPKGTQIFIGAPAKPMPREVSAAIAEVVASTPGIAEAHLPQFFAPGVLEQPAQVLVIATSPNASVDAVVSVLGAGLANALPPGHHLDVWPQILGSQLLNEVRAAGCEIFRTRTASSAASSKKPWWRFWGAG